MHGFAQVFLTEHYLGIAMEFAPGGDMFEYVVKKNGLKEEEARWFFQQLIVGLDYCHRMVGAREVLGKAWRECAVRTAAVGMDGACAASCLQFCA